MAIDHPSVACIYDYQLYAQNTSLLDSEQLGPISKDLKTRLQSTMETPIEGSKWE